MSSYLSIYLKPKVKEGEEPKKPMMLCSFSRNSEIYRAVHEEVNPVYAGDEERYTDITISDWDRVIESLDNSIKFYNEQNEKEKKATDIINECLTTIVAKASNEISDRAKLHELIEMVEDKVRDSVFDDNTDPEYYEDLLYAKSLAETFKTMVGETEWEWIDFSGMCVNID